MSSDSIEDRKADPFHIDTEGSLCSAGSSGSSGTIDSQEYHSPLLPEPIKRRNRGFSVRSQNVPLASSGNASASQIQLAPSSSSSPDNSEDLSLAAAQALADSRPQDSATQASSHQPIELRQVAQTYKAGDEWEVFRGDDTNDSNMGDNTGSQRRPGFNRLGSNVTNDSFVDLQSETTGNNTAAADGTANLSKNFSKGPLSLGGGSRFFPRTKSKGKLYALRRLFNTLLGISETYESVGGRRVPVTINLSRVVAEFPTFRASHGDCLLIDERKDVPYIDNTVTSSKYTLLSFLPRQLIAQFSKLANCYFMVVAIMQLIPSWSTTGTTTTIIPLCIFISISIAREGWDDLRRHRLDTQENEHVCTVIREGAPQFRDSTDSSGLRSANRSRSGTTGSTMAAAAAYWRRHSAGSTVRLRAEEEDHQSETASMDESSSRDGTLPNSFSREAALNSSGIHSQKLRWRNVKVGDIIRLECDEWVPADIVLLTSTNDLGEAFVETMALDGETNLKSRIPNSSLNKACNTARDLYGMNATVVSEDPNTDLYNYEGSLEMVDPATLERKQYPLGPEHVIYRGSIIRNTEACLGMVVFTGEESKIRMNAIKRPRIKAPKLQHSINIIVVFMVFVVVSLSAFSLMGERLLYEKYRDVNWYVYKQDIGVAATLMGFIIMYNTLIPLSLYVTMEIIKIMQMVLLQWDLDMYDRASNTPMEARTATILEELGQVSYVFSDKTGTLTDNLMLFRKFSVAGTAWELDDIGASASAANDDDNDTAAAPTAPGTIRPAINGHPVSGSARPSTESFNPPARTSEEVMGRGNVTFTGRPSMASVRSARPRPSNLSRQLSGATTGSMSITGGPPTEVNPASELIAYIQQNPLAPFAKKAGFFLLSIALCHTCLPKQKGGGKIEYQASSPDELALVQAAGDMGYIFMNRKRGVVTVKTFPDGFDQDPTIETYKLLEVVDFTSARKRMSVLVRFPDGKVRLLCKGADNIITEKLAAHELALKKKAQLAQQIAERQQAEADVVLSRRSMAGSTVSRSPRPSGGLGRMSMNFSRPSGVSGRAKKDVDSLMMEENSLRDVTATSESIQQKLQSQQQQPSFLPSSKVLGNEEYMIEKTLQQIEEFSSDGLRTLMYAYRDIDELTYKAWAGEYAAAKTSVTHRAQKVEEVGGRLEVELTLLGATAIEDKLQDGVPETIEKLRRAGMKMWMLTGDKRETAINIGHSCRLIKDYSKVIILSSETNSLSELGSMMNAAEIEINEGNVAHCVVVIDGGTLADIEEDLTLMSVFISLGVKADSVICCRASPSQKAGLVGKVRNHHKGKVTLAIGDGANDIAMIQNADLGIGITGREGLQASRASDYSIARFRFLQKLLLVHGRYNYVRTSKFVLCTFYKELLFYLSQLLYQRQTLFTGSSLYEPWSLSMFNTLFTSLPVIFIGMFEKDLNPATLIAVPELYAVGRMGQLFNLPVFVKWMVLAAAQTVALSFLMWYIFGFEAIMDNTAYGIGNLLYTVFIVLINTKISFVETHDISKMPCISWIIMVGGYTVWQPLLMALYKNKESKIFHVKAGISEHFGPDPTYWGTLVVLVIVGLFMDFGVRLVRMWVSPNDTDVFQQLEQQPDVCEKLEMSAYSELKQGWCWEHESMIKEEHLNDWKPGRRMLHYFRSFVSKGSIHPSEATRRRAPTMVNPTEPPPNFPSIVKVASSDRYDDEMLPSGKIVRKKKKKDREGDRMAEVNAEIDELLEERMKDTEDL